LIYPSKDHDCCVPFARIRALSLQRNKGAGTLMAINAKADMLFPQPYPNFPYKTGAKVGKAKPAMLCRSCTAAIADAVYRVYESIT